MRLFVLILNVTIVIFMSMFGYYFFAKKGTTEEQLKQLTIVAHRAGHGTLQNTISGIRNCLANGVTDIEVDVQITLDGELVLFHDENICCENGASLRVCEATLEDIKRICGESGMPDIATLGDALDAIGGRCRLLIDAKNYDNAERFAKALINEAALYQAADWVSVQSLDDALLGHLHRLGHPFPLEKIFTLKLPLLPLIVDNGLSLFNFDKYDYISSFNIYYKAVTPSLVRAIHEKGKKVKLWSPDAPCSISALAVDGVITDFPERWLPRS